MSDLLSNCIQRPHCMVTTLVGNSKGKRLEERVVQRPRSVLDVACGFEQAGTVAYCPKARRLRGGEDG